MMGAAMTIVVRDPFYGRPAWERRYEEYMELWKTYASASLAHMWYPGRSPGLSGDAGGYGNSDETLSGPELKRAKRIDTLVYCELPSALRNAVCHRYLHVTLSIGRDEYAEALSDAREFIVADLRQQHLWVD